MQMNGLNFPFERGNEENILSRLTQQRLTSGSSLTATQAGIDQFVSQVGEVAGDWRTMAAFAAGIGLFSRWSSFSRAAIAARSGVAAEAVVAETATAGRFMGAGFLSARSVALSGPILGAGVFLGGCSTGSNPSSSEGGAGSGPSHSDGGAGGMDAAVPTSHPPIFQSQQSYGEVPCGPGSMIPDLDLDSVGGLGTCANFGTNVHHLFQWDPMTAGAVSSILPLSNPPDQVLRLSSGEVVLSTYQSSSESQNSGLTFVSATFDSENHVPFDHFITNDDPAPRSDIIPNRPASSGRNVGNYFPRYPKGMAEMGNEIFVATSNYDEVNRDYLPGNLLAYNRSSGQFRVMRTTGYNPTSVATVIYQGQPAVLVVNSGAIDRTGAPVTESRLNLFNPSTHALIADYGLGNVGAGVMGEVALTPDRRRAVLPTADNSGRILVVDLQTGTSQSVNLRDHGAVSEQILLTQVHLSEDGRSAFVGNFNDGQLYVIDLGNPSATVQRIPVDLNTTDGDGLSDGVWRDGHFFMGVGSRLQRLNFQP